MARLSNKRLAWLIAAVALAWIAEWAIWLTSDFCGAEDGLNCTAAGWIGLYFWFALGVALVVLLGVAAVRVVRRLVR